MWVREYIDFSNPMWYMDSFGKCDLPQANKSCTWTRDSSRAVDYFGFTRWTWNKIRLLEFAVGRPVCPPFAVRCREPSVRNWICGSRSEGVVSHGPDHPETVDRPIGKGPAGHGEGMQ